MRDLSLSAGCARRAALMVPVVLAVLCASRVAAARDRLAVVVAAADDPDLGDNLTEAAIGSLADRGENELVGGRELRTRLREDPEAPTLEACVARPACLARLGAAAGARRAVIGTVRRDENGYALELALVSTDTGAQQAEWSGAVEDDVGALVAAVGTGVRSLFAPKATAPQSTTATASLDAKPPEGGPPVLQLEARAGDERAGGRHGNARVGYLGAASLALAVVALSAAAVAGSTAEAPLLGSTRADMQADLRRREPYASAANGLLVAGGALSVTAAVLFIWWWRADK
jgi:hypothetical protein